MKVPYVNFAAQFAENKAEAMAAVENVFSVGDFILGKAVTAFEKEFADICGVKHAIGVANGTDSIILIFKALGIKEGDEVITASNSWISSASAIALCGATPVFADVEEDQNISPESIRKVITPRTKAILPVHLTGRMADMKKIQAIGREFNISVIEDAAQAIGAERDGLRSGAASLAASFSLHPLKNLNAAGDAGIITTDDDELARQLRLLRHHGLKNRDEVVRWGYNSRLDTMQAAILRTRLPLLNQQIEKRRANARRYIDALKSVVACPVERENEFHTYHVFVIQCVQRNELQAFLQEREIETKVHYPIPIHRQEAAAYLKVSEASLPETNKQAERILSLPIHQYLTNEQVGWVIESIKAFYSSPKANA